MVLSDLNKFLTGHAEEWRLNIRKLSSHIFRNHKKESTNDLIYTDHPHPWKWSRVLVSLIGLSILLLIAVFMLGPIPFPWLSLIVAAIIPISLGLFIYEFNDTQFPVKNLIIIFFIGSATSLIAVGFLSLPIGLPFLDMTLAVIVEEVAKYIPILLTIKLLKIKRLSSALLIGWTIGAGFDVAESLGYSTIGGIVNYITDGAIITINMFSTMLLRLLTAFNSHSLWGAILGATAIISLREDGKKHHYGRFAIWFAIPVFLHFFRNVVANYIASIGWFIVLTIILQLIAIPIFFYLLDAGLSNYLRNLPQDVPPVVSIEDNDKIPQQT